MLGHYLAIAFRNFRHRKGTTFSKIVALSLGLACFVGAYTVSDYFAGYDSHWANAGRIFVVKQHVVIPGVPAGIANSLYSSPPLAKYLKADFPKLEAVARTATLAQSPVHVGDTSSLRIISGADADFLKIFDLPFVKGDPTRALSAPKSAVLTADVAEGLFGTTDVIGRTLRIGKSEEVTVTGVVSEIPPPSHFARTRLDQPLQILVSMDVIDDLLQARFAALGANSPRISEMDLWVNQMFSTFVLLPKDGSFTRADLDRGLEDFGARHVPKAMGTGTFATAPLNRFAETTLNKIYLGGRLGLSFTTILYLVGALILAVACLDFANLTTAEASSRAKEIGMRKTMGATRRQICVQTMVEVGVLTALSLVLALVAVSIAISALNHPTDLGMRIPGLARIDFWGGILALLVGVTLAAGGYPALVLARIRPVLALRLGAGRGGSKLLRAILIGAQFAATSFLVVAVAVIFFQNAQLRHTALDRTENPVLTIQSNLTSAGIDPATFRAQMLATPGVVSYSATSIPPYGIMANSLTFSPSADPGAKSVEVNERYVSYDFFKTAGVKLLAGREFSETKGDRPADVRPEKGSPAPIVVNKNLVEAFGWSPSAAIGKTIYWRIASISGPTKRQEISNPASIIGVAEDSPLQLTSVGPREMVYGLGVSTVPFPIIQISKTDVAATVKRIEAVWARLAPGTPMQRRFMDEAFESAISMFLTISRASASLAMFAILISSMGLIGMATHMIGRRRHEIGVRKTLGASTGQILKMILWDLSKPVVIANLIAWPVAFLAAETYLSLFTTHMAVTPLPFLASLVVTLAVAWGAVGLQTFRAASVRPAAVLRYE